MRYVLIDEVTKTRQATPYNTDVEVFAALRKRLQELFDDPSCYPQAEYLNDSFGTSELGKVSNEELAFFLSDLMVCQEGAKGVWTNFSSADRCSVCGRWPEDKEFGNADTRHYPTGAVPSGTPVSTFCSP